MSGSVIKEIGGVNGAPAPYPIFQKWHVGAGVLTLRATRRLSPRWGVEGKGAWSFGQVNSRDSLNHVNNRPGYIFFVAARAPVRISPANASLIAHLAPGLAVLSRGGSAWIGIGGKTDPAGTVALDLGGPLGRRSKFAIRLEIEAYFSFTQYRAPVFNPTTRRFHPDVAFSIGFDYRIKR